MKKIKGKIGIILLIIVVSFGAISMINKYKESNKMITSQSGFMLGTLINIQLFEPQPKELFQGIFDVIQDIENKMSINIENSEVSEVNRNAGKSYVKVSSDTYFVIKKGKFYSSLSGGNFDISIGPLVKLWGIGNKGASIPHQNQIDQALSKVNYEDILLNDSDNSVMLAREGMIIDLGGIAKGYAADAVAEYLISNNINSAIIDLGGNVLALGAKSNNDPWRIGIQNPFNSRGKSIGIINVKDKTIVTSGIYERYFEENGKRYHHILSPFTGFPVDNSLASVSIVADSSIDADGLSTTVFALGLENGYELIESLDGVDAIFVKNNKEVYVTKSLKDNFKLLDDSIGEFTLMENIK